MINRDLTLAESVSRLRAPARPAASRGRMLVVISSYGTRNLRFLEPIIARYQRMSLEVDVVVISESPKELGPNVEVVVGLPSANPWSLPFAHKRLFAERLERYDLFAYSEDDVVVTEENIQAFLRLTPELEADEIAGFLRYEFEADGTRSMPDVHGPAHWRAQTVCRRGGHVIAEFSNEHAAFYLLTQTQLRRALASGGFLRGPCEGNYDMICTAATDPYTNCGMRKVICISDLASFLIHHAPNHYAGRLGVTLEAFQAQVATLVRMCDGAHPVTALCPTEPRIFQRKWFKNYYDNPCGDLVSMIPEGARQVLSVGCGWGATEAWLGQRGLEVTALPLDSVIGAAAERRGIRVKYAALEAGLRGFEAGQFDVVLLDDLLPMTQEPARVLGECLRVLQPGGALLLGAPNFDYLPILSRRLLRHGDYRKLEDYAASGLHPLSVAQVTRWLRGGGAVIDRLAWREALPLIPVSGAVNKRRGWARLTRGTWEWLQQTGRALDERWFGGTRPPAQGFGLWLRPGGYVSSRWVLRARKTA